MPKRPPPKIYFSAKEIATLCEVDVSTARRWLRGAICPPKTAQMILSGDLGIFDPAWAGWIVRRGKLVSPENWISTPGEVRATQMVEAQLQALRHEVKRLRYALEDAQFQEQPLPADVDMASVKWNIKLPR